MVSADNFVQGYEKSASGRLCCTHNPTSVRDDGKTWAGLTAMMKRNEWCCSEDKYKRPQFSQSIGVIDQLIAADVE